MEKITMKEACDSLNEVLNRDFKTIFECKIEDYVQKLKDQLKELEVDEFMYSDAPEYLTTKGNFDYEMVSGKTYTLSKVILELEEILND